MIYSFYVRSNSDIIIYVLFDAWMLEWCSYSTIWNTTTLAFELVMDNDNDNGRNDFDSLCVDIFVRLTQFNLLSLRI